MSAATFKWRYSINKFIKSRQIHTTRWLQQRKVTAARFIPELKPIDPSVQHEDTQQVKTTPQPKSLSLTEFQLPHDRKESNKIANAVIDYANRYVTIAWSDSEVDKFPWVFLRDACTCQSCYNVSTKSRKLMFYELDVETRATTLEFAEDAVTVHWDDGHQSAFTNEWLKARSFRHNMREVRQEVYSETKKFWNAQTISLPTHNFGEVLTKDERTLAWSRDLEIYGATLMTNVPCELGQVTKLCSHIAFPYQTHYGKSFQVQSKPQPVNLAYTTDAIGFHTDLPYMSYQPQIQMLHCIKQTEMEGGSNLLVDAFYCAELLRQTDPEAWEILATDRWDFWDYGTDSGKDFHLQSRKPIFDVDKNGNYSAVNIADFARDTYINQPIEKIYPMYRALKKYTKLLYSKSNCIEHKMEAGHMIVFDNLRVLHARSAFSATGGERLIEGAYINWDQLRSAARRLKTKLKTWKHAQKTD